MPLRSSLRFVLATLLALQLPLRASTLPQPDPERRQRALAALGTTGLLLVPDVTNSRVMAFDPDTGALVDPDFVPAHPALLAAPTTALVHANATWILVSDEATDVIHKFSLSGIYLGIFAPAGGVDTGVLDGPRGMTLNPFTMAHYLVVSQTGSVPVFDLAGNFAGDCVPAATVGAPVDVEFDVSATRLLVSGLTGGQVRAFSGCPGTNTQFTGIDFDPQQVHVDQAAGGAGVPAVYVVGNNGPHEGVVVYDEAGAPLSILDPDGLDSYRGVHLLGNGNLLVTTDAGVHTSTAAGVFVETVIGGLAARHVEFAEPISADIFADGFESGDTSGWSSSIP